jgi:transposase InsO family protein
VTVDNTEIKAVNLANNGTTEVTGTGKVLIKAEVNKQTRNVDVHDTLLVPELKTNLLSVAKLCDRGYTVIFKNKCAIIKNVKSNLELIADRKNNLYYLRGSDSDINQSAKHASESFDSSKKKLADLEKWHSRMGHLNVKDLMQSSGKGNIRGLNLKKSSGDFNCEVCALNKLTRAPFPKHSERITGLLEIVHSDLCGPIRIPSIGKSLYFMTFIDDSSRYCVVKFLKCKSEALNAFKEIKNLWENQKSAKIKIFMSDNGGEFMSKEFDDFLKLNGIEHRTSAPYCPEQCGTAERKNRVLVEMARCLLSQSKLPLNMWAEAVNTSNYIRNRCPTKSLNGKTPYEIWNNKKPNVNYFKIFGCTAFCLDNKPNHKFSKRSKKGIFVGYSDNSKAFRIFFPEENRFVISRSVKFFEESTYQRSYDEIDHLAPTSPLNPCLTSPQ